MLGMLGQVVYHLLSAAHATRAPWPVVVLVSCMPVVTLGFGAALTHLLHDTVADSVPISALDEATGTVAPTVHDAVPAIPDAPEVPRTVARARRRPADVHARKAERVFAGHLAEGRLPSLRAVMADLHLGQPKAREVRQHLATVATASGEARNG